jgi:hypothetical protein
VQVVQMMKEQCTFPSKAFSFLGQPSKASFASSNASWNFLACAQFLFFFASSLLR